MESSFPSAVNRKKAKSNIYDDQFLKKMQHNHSIAMVGLIVCQSVLQSEKKQIFSSAIKDRTLHSYNIKFRLVFAIQTFVAL